MYKAILKSSFRASHAVKMPDGTVEKAHWHDWKLTSCFSRDSLDELGFVIEFGLCQEIINSATTTLANQNINELGIFSPNYPTTELIAKYIFEQIATRLPSTTIKLDYVELTEQPNCLVRYSGNK